MNLTLILCMGLLIAPAAKEHARAVKATWDAEERVISYVVEGQTFEIHGFTLEGVGHGFDLPYRTAYGERGTVMIGSFHRKALDLEFPDGLTLRVRGLTFDELLGDTSLSLGYTKRCVCQVDPEFSCAEEDCVNREACSRPAHCGYRMGRSERQRRAPSLVNIRGDKPRSKKSGGFGHSHLERIEVGVALGKAVVLSSNGVFNLHTPQQEGMDKLALIAHYGIRLQALLVYLKGGIGATYSELEAL